MIPPPGGPGGAHPQPFAYVYLLQSLTTQRYYVGWTTDVRRRLEAHQHGASRYTRPRGPWRLIGEEAYPSLAAAKAQERLLKRSPRTLARFKKRLLNQMRQSRQTAGPRQGVG